MRFDGAWRRAGKRWGSFHDTWIGLCLGDRQDSVKENLGVRGVFEVFETPLRIQKLWKRLVVKFQVLAWKGDEGC
jgi:hypothetical protein